MRRETRDKPTVLRARQCEAPQCPAPSLSTGTSPALWFRFPCADRALKRVGHRTCLWNDQLYLVGGFGEDGTTASPQVCTLDLYP